MLTNEQRAVRPAFLASAYGPPGTRILLGSVSGEAPDWARGPWAIVTAWNPAARQQSQTQNREAQEGLKRVVQAAGFAPLPALNGAGEWAEESWLVLGVGLRRAREWGQAFGQAAVLWGHGERVLLAWEGGPLERFWAVQTLEKL